MDTNTHTTGATQNNSSESAQDRRELIQKLGKFAMYVAPFAILATSNKASAATSASGRGPGKH